MMVALLAPLVGLALAGDPGAGPAAEGVGVVFPPSLSVPVAAALLREGGEAPIPVALERRREGWVALVGEDVLAGDVVWVLVGEGWMSAPARGTPTEALPLLLAGHMSGFVVSATPGQLPRWGWVVVEPPDASVQLPKRLPMVLSGGDFLTPVPAGTWKTTLEFPGFSRVEVGAVAIAPGATVALPSPVALEPAATVGLHLHVQGAAALPGPCRTWLFAAEELDAAQCALTFEGTDAWRRGTLVDRLGGVQLVADAAGEALGVVECRPWPPQLVGPLTLEVGEEAVV